MRIRGLVAILVSVAGLALAACVAPAGVLLTVPQVESEQETEMALPVEMSRIPADTVMPSGHSVITDCQDASVEYPYTPYDWPDASATLLLEQGHSMSTVSIEVSNARPNTYYTIWLRLQGTDANDMPYGGNPLMGIGATPLVPTSALDHALSATGEDSGRDDEVNGFHTDEQGNASFTVELDFPIINGAYPFQKFEGFDPTDERYTAEEPRIYPVAIVGSGGPFTLRVASHCTDGVGHGLVPGAHEGWFQWKFDQ